MGGNEGQFFRRDRNGEQRREGGHSQLELYQILKIRNREPQLHSGVGKGHENSGLHLVF